MPHNYPEITEQERLHLIHLAQTWKRLEDQTEHARNEYAAHARKLHAFGMTPHQVKTMTGIPTAKTNKAIRQIIKEEENQ